MIRTRLLAAALAAAALLLAASAQDNVLNLYSARHYQTDEALYADFTKATGIRINRVDADDAGILARLKSEGAAHPVRVSQIPSVRLIVDEELEAVWADKKTAKESLDTAVARGNVILAKNSAPESGKKPAAKKK